MRKKLFIFFPLVLSGFLHLVAIFSCTLYIKAEGNPSFYSWFDIISRKDLFLGTKKVVFPKGIKFSSPDMRREYFFPSHPSPWPEQGYNLGSFMPDPAKTLPSSGRISHREIYCYLWPRRTNFSSWEEEVVSYKTYISPYGKVLFLYPEKLPVNSYGSLNLQKYLREAILFLDNRFLWTKLEGVVK
ncbi:MAG: hypothetical protein ABIE75_00400 [Candidatus Omnitrophota bacterium]